MPDTARTPDEYPQNQYLKAVQRQLDGPHPEAANIHNRERFRNGEETPQASQQSQQPLQFQQLPKPQEQPSTQFFGRQLDEASTAGSGSIPRNMREGHKVRAHMILYVDRILKLLPTR